MNDDETAATLNVTNTYNPPKPVIEAKDIAAHKVWENMDGTENTDTHPTTYFKLYRSVNGSEPEPVEGVGLRELKDGDTTANWYGMLAKDSDGNSYTYEVKEVDSEGNPAVPDGYIKKEDGLTVTNVKIPLNDVTANKVWTKLDGTIDMSDHPTIYFKLYRNIEGGEPEAVEDADLIELTNGTTTATWENMPYCDDQGNPYTYSVKETDELGQDGVPANYTKLEEGLTVTNTKTTVDIPVKESNKPTGSTSTPKKAKTVKAVKTNASDIARTGDPNNLFLTAGVCLAAAAALVLLIRRRKAK
ncbi:MAG: Cna B-type domain-containing protein [Anaerovoracaceae bacterium]